MWCLIIRIKRNDQIHGRSLHKKSFRIFNASKDLRCDCKGRCRWIRKTAKIMVHLEGFTINMPMVIGMIDEQIRLEPLLPQIKRMVNDNGIISLHEVDIF